ncbi:MAG: TIGR02234 family membrane protein [Mycobacteriaceae bacterium]
MAEGARGSRSGADRRVLVILVVAAALLWGSSRLTWVTATITDDLRGTRSEAVNGSQWAAELAPLALAALAAVAAVLAVRGAMLRVVAVAVLAVAAAAAVPAVRVLAGGSSAERALTLLDTGSARVSTAGSVLGPLLAVVAGTLLLGAGLALLRSRNRSPGLSSRYETPAARRAQATAELVEPDGDLAERQLWDAMDAGLDPTLEPPAQPPGHTPAQPPGEHGESGPPEDPGQGPSTLAAGPNIDRGEGGPRQ